MTSSPTQAAALLEGQELLLSEKMIDACRKYSDLQRGHVVAVLSCPDLSKVVAALVKERDHLQSNLTRVQDHLSHMADERAALLRRIEELENPKCFICGDSTPPREIHRCGGRKP